MAVAKGTIRKKVVDIHGAKVKREKWKSEFAFQEEEEIQFFFSLVTISSKEEKSFFFWFEPLLVTMSWDDFGG